VLRNKLDGVIEKIMAEIGNSKDGLVNVMKFKEIV
jgi:hypothetical protein